MLDEDFARCAFLEAGFETLAIGEVRFELKTQTLEPGVCLISVSRSF